MSYIYLDIETTGLDAFNDRIVMIGIYDGEQNRIFWNEDEKQLIDAFFNYSLANSILVTFNGDSFDLKFIQLRAQKYGLNPVRLISLRHIDFMWIIKKHFQTQSRKIPTMRKFAEFFDIHTDDVFTGKDVIALWEKRDIESIRKHLESDLMLMKKIHEKIMPVCDYNLRSRYRAEGFGLPEEGEKEVDEL